MKDGPYSVLHFVARLLPRPERDAVVGDLLESGDGALRGSFGILGLALRRQAVLWTNWRPWLSAFLVALPFSFLLMGLSLSFWVSCRRLFGMGAGAVIFGSPLLACHFLLLAASAWSCGRLVASVSRGTLWASLIACFAPCLFCLSRFHVAHVSRLSLLVFLIPAAWGMRQGLRIVRVPVRMALVVAVFVTMVMVITGWSAPQYVWTAQWWFLQSMFAVPAWFLAATAYGAEPIEVTA